MVKAVANGAVRGVALMRAFDRARAIVRESMVKGLTQPVLGWGIEN
jgi:hypothetical protein